MRIYKIRPYTLEILGAIQPFFEIVAISKMNFNQLKFIIDHLERLLNIPVDEKNIQTKRDFKQIQEHRKNAKAKPAFTDPTDQYDRIGRFKPKLLKKQMYFQFMICQKNYCYFEEINEYIENFHILMKNRKASRIYFLTSNIMRLVAAMKQGFRGIPISKFDSTDDDDFQLNLIENYLIKLHYNKALYQDEEYFDFKILLQKSEYKKDKKKEQENDECYKRKEEEFFIDDSLGGIKEIDDRADDSMESEKRKKLSKKESEEMKISDNALSDDSVDFKKELDALKQQESRNANQSIFDDEQSERDHFNTILEESKNHSEN